MPTSLRSIAKICFVFLLGVQLSYGQGILSTGNWIKVRVAKSTFVRVDKNWFNKQGISVNFATAAVYAGPSGMLAESVRSSADLREIPVFEGPDYLLFWGDSPHEARWTADQKRWDIKTHLYADSSYYFIRLDKQNPKRITTISPKAATTPSLNAAWGLMRNEPELTNLLQSGREWVGNAFYGTSSLAVQYTLPDWEPGSKIYLSSRFLSSNTNDATFVLQFAANQQVALDMPKSLGGRYDQKAFSRTYADWLLPTLDKSQWNWSIRYTSGSGTGYLDFLQIQYVKPFDAKQANPHYFFTHTKDTLVSIRIKNYGASNQTWIKDTDAWKIVAHVGDFTLGLAPGTEMAVYNGINFQEPIFCERLKTQDPLANTAKTTLVIISSPTLRAQAQKLATYKNALGIQTHVALSDEIYNAYSGGKQDISSIRNYLRDVYRQGNQTLAYVILFGDASIDYKSKNTVSTALEKNCFVPTFQSPESEQPLLSYASDDFYGFMDDEQTEIRLAIGRIPVKSPAEATMFINKLMAYQKQAAIPSTKPIQFAWVADDGDSNLHMQDAEDFATAVEKTKLPIQIQKTYLDQFPMIQANGIYTSPKAHDAVMNLINKEADFIHFVGHGSESGWTDEKILTNNDLVGLSNSQHLPILFTATCQFGRFDDPNQISGGELSLLSDRGGAIALISTTRPVFQSNNYLFGQAFYANMDSHTSASYRLGDLFRDTKNSAQLSANRNISLLGDPTLALPWQMLPISIKQDTLFPGSSNKLIGTWNPVAPRNASMQFYMYAAKTKQKTLGTKNTSFVYQQAGKLAWSAIIDPLSNQFLLDQSSLPTLPGEQSIHFFAIGNGIGIAKNMVVGGVTSRPLDNEPPKIAFVSFRPEANNLLSLTVSDNIGLKWIGPTNLHAELVIDDSIRIPLSTYFNPRINQMASGEITMPLGKLKKGLHKITVFCWDVNNNFAQESFNITVQNEELDMHSWSVYPNPIVSPLFIQFKQESPWSVYEYEANIYTMLGAKLMHKRGKTTTLNDTNGLIQLNLDERELASLQGYSILTIRILDNDGLEVLNGSFKISTLK